MKEALALNPENPRFYWVQGPNFWYAPPERGGGQDKAIAAYQKGIALAKAHKASPDPFNPSWGEPELLMNLAWSNLHRTQPDLPVAQQYAQSALRLVPYWHYVKDILMPQILIALDTAAIQRMRDKDVLASKAGDFDMLKTLFTDDAVVMPRAATLFADVLSATPIWLGCAPACRNTKCWTIAKRSKSYAFVATRLSNGAPSAAG